jgi:hypothetical protein
MKVIGFIVISFLVASFDAFCSNNSQNLGRFARIEIEAKERNYELGKQNAQLEREIKESILNHIDAVAKSSDVQIDVQINVSGIDLVSIEEVERLSDKFFEFVKTFNDIQLKILLNRELLTSEFISSFDHNSFFDIDRGKEILSKIDHEVISRKAMIVKIAQDMRCLYEKNNISGQISNVNSCLMSVEVAQAMHSRLSNFIENLHKN